MQPGWCQPVGQEFTENECEALPGVAYPGVRDNRSTVNTKTGYDDDDDNIFLLQKQQLQHMYMQPGWCQPAFVAEQSSALQMYLIIIIITIKITSS